MTSDKPKPHWQYVAEAFPTREEVERIKAELARREQEQAEWKAQWERDHPRRPKRTGLPDRRIGQPDQRPAEEQQERRAAVTARRAPGSDRRISQRTTKAG